MKNIPGFSQGLIIRHAATDADTVQDLLNDFHHTALINGMHHVYVDPEIIWFSEMKVSSSDYVMKYGRVMRCTIPLTHSMITNRCMNAGHYTEYGLVEALRFATLLVNHRQIQQKNNTGIALYLKSGEIYDNSLRYMMYIFRENKGILSVILTLVENDAYLVQGDGVLCRMLTKH